MPSNKVVLAEYRVVGRRVFENFPGRSVPWAGSAGTGHLDWHLSAAAAAVERGNVDVRVETRRDPSSPWTDLEDQEGSE